MAGKAKRRKAGQNPRTKPATRHSQALDFIIYKIGILRRLIERYANPAITEAYDMTIAEWRVLTHLFSTSPMTATELSRRLWTDKAEVSRACASLIGIAGESDQLETLVPISGLQSGQTATVARKLTDVETRVEIAEQRGESFSLDLEVELFSGL